MTRLICLSSGKGGVGKTTVAANLGSALNEFGMETVLIDANLTNPSLGFHLGIPLYPETLHDVLKGDVDITDATYLHNSGLKVVPAGLSVDDLKNTSPESLPDVLLDLVGGPDFVLIDSAAGLGNEALHAIESSDELLVVTNPDLPSVTDALKTANIAEQAGTDITGVVLNRVKGSSSELESEEVESMIGYPVISSIPEDEDVQDSISLKKPLLHHKPKKNTSERFRKLAADIADIDYEHKVRESKGFFSRMLSFLKK